MSGRDACGLRHGDLRFKSLWGRETCEGRAEICGLDACGRRHRDLRWSPHMWPRNVRGVCRNSRRGRMRAAPLGLSMEPPFCGHETCEGCAEIRGADACGLRHWDLRRSSLWGHDTCEECAEMGVADACGLRHWDVRWSSLWGRETQEGAPKQSRAEGRGRDGRRGEGAVGRRDAGRCLFKTRTQRHRMVGKHRAGHTRAPQRAHVEILTTTNCVQFILI